jgi:hypothetical protein
MFCFGRFASVVLGCAIFGWSDSAQEAVPAQAQNRVGQWTIDYQIHALTVTLEESGEPGSAPYTQLQCGTFPADLLQA